MPTGADTPTPGLTISPSRTEGVGVGGAADGKAIGTVEPQLVSWSIPLAFAISLFAGGLLVAGGAISGSNTASSNQAALDFGYAKL